MKMKMKIYKITFNEYTNCLRDTVWSGDKEINLHCQKDYGDALGYLMVLTDDLSKVVKEFQNCGKGIRSLEYVGSGFLRNYNDVEKEDIS